MSNLLELEYSDFEYLLEKQKVLDGYIREKNNITDDIWFKDIDMNYKHLVAMRVELSEFINEIYDVWKYWKNKPVDRERVIDEAIDVIHFLMLLIAKRERNNEDALKEFYKRVYKNTPRELDSQTLYRIMTINYELEEIMAFVLYALSQYNFTREDVLNQYKKKNKVNFERQEQNY